MTIIPGYTYGMASVTASPISVEEFQQLKASTGFTDDDIYHLRMAGDVLNRHMDAVLDDWYGFLATQPQTGFFTTDGQGKPIMEYRAATRERFRQWILDTCQRDYDQDWLNYQHEIGLRHHHTKKNQTDQVNSVPHTALRYIIAYIVPITLRLKPFMALDGHTDAVVEKMHQAWFKSVVMQIALWSVPYVHTGEW